MTDISTEDFLAHYGINCYDSLTEEILSHAGVKGMKWGVRKSDEQLAKERRATNEGDFQGLTIDKKKLAIAVGASLAVAGLIATGVILSKNLSSLKAAKNIVDTSIKKILTIPSIFFQKKN